MEFLNSRRQRICAPCNVEYKSTETPVCPACGTKGKRIWDRLTIIAGRRFGKSKIGSIAGVEEATIPNSIGWACAPTVPKLHRYVIPAFQELIPPEWVESWNSEFLDLRLKNGSLIHFQTLEDPDQGRGQGLDWLWIDEVSELTLAHWDVIRPSLAGDTVAFFTTSPRGYDWVYKELYLPAENGVPGYWAAHARTIDSANPRINKDFLDREKAQMSDIMFRQEYEGDFVVFTGSVYGSLMDGKLLRSEDQIRSFIPEWPKIDNWRQVLVGIDTGADHPFGAVKLVSTERGMVVVGEYLERDKTFTQHCSALKRLAASPTCRYAINKNERQAGIELAQHGIMPLKSENDLVAGTERVKSWLHANQLYFVEANCPETLNQMRAYRWAENRSPKDEQKRKEKVFKVNDELPDCLRYALMTWPQLPDGPPEASKLRDLSTLPENVQRVIMVERKATQDPEKKLNRDFDTVQDFWA